MFWGCGCQATGYASPEGQDGSDRNRPDNTYGVLVSIGPVPTLLPSPFLPPPSLPHPSTHPFASVSDVSLPRSRRRIIPDEGDTSFLTLLVIPIFPSSEPDHRSSSAKSAGALRPSICLNLILSHVCAGGGIDDVAPPSVAAIRFRSRARLIALRRVARRSTPAHRPRHVVPLSRDPRQRTERGVRLL